MNPDENVTTEEEIPLKKKRKARNLKADPGLPGAKIKKHRAPRKSKLVAPADIPNEGPKTFPYKKLLLVNIVFVGLVALSLWQVNTRDSQRNVELPMPPEVTTAVSTTSPVKLIIPSIGVDAEIQRVGKTSDGKMAVPTNFTDVGWYKLGFYPGTVGNAVIAGHLDNGKGTPAVMNNLSDLRIGEKVYVTNKEGQTLQFVVTGMSLYDYNNAPLDMIFGSSTKAHLNLITCDGVWDDKKKNYDKRLVVFTDFVGVLSEGSEVSIEGP